MRVAVCAPLVLLACCTLASGAGKRREVPKVNEIRLNVDYLDKTWGITCKSHKVNSLRTVSDIELLLEFTKDVPNLSEIQLAFGDRARPDSGLVWFYIFNEDNVILGKTKRYYTLGELTGVKGDAFKLVFRSPAFIRSKNFKVEARPDEKLKEIIKDRESKKDKH
jgi:hypothetical protein